jgi:Tol biopolymer transport system component
MPFTIRPRFFLWLLICALTVSGCSIEVGQTTTVTATPPAEVRATAASRSVFPTTQVPVSWAHLRLTGKLIYITSASEGASAVTKVQMLDLVSGNLYTIYSIPAGWIYYATVSPDAKWMVMSYIPSSSNRALYIMPLDATTPPQLLFTPPTPDDHYVQAEWSPDGKYIYYVHYNGNNRLKDLLDPVYDISRISYPNGQSEKIVDSAFWPRFSSDGSKLVYVSILPESGSIDPSSGKNELVVANADGSDHRKAAFSGAAPLDIIDAPLISPNGQSILFSAPEPSQTNQQTWLEKLAGIQVAKAHSVPSDWWSVPISGGTPTRLTNLQTVNLFGSVSLNKKYIASISGDGLFVMDLDGSNLTQLISDPGVHGTVSWIP